MRLPKAWKKMGRQRDARPSLIDTTERELTILFARIRKARKLADLLRDEGLHHDQVALLVREDDDGLFWRDSARMARVSEPSKMTRLLTVELMRDREQTLELLKSNGWKVRRD